MIADQGVTKVREESRLQSWDELYRHPGPGRSRSGRCPYMLGFLAVTTPPRHILDHRLFLLDTPPSTGGHGSMPPTILDFTGHLHREPSFSQTTRRGSNQLGNPPPSATFRSTKQTRRGRHTKNPVRLKGGAGHLSGGKEREKKLKNLGKAHLPVRDCYLR